MISRSLVHRRLRSASAPLLLLAALTLVGSRAEAQPANDNCATAQLIPAAGPFPYLTTTVDLTAATTTGDPASSCTTTGSRSVWYAFTPTASGSWSFSLCNAVTGTTVLDTVLGLYSGTACASFSEVACDDNSCGNRSALTTTLTSGTTYYVVASMVGAPAPAPGEGNVQLQVSRPPAAPANDNCGTAAVIPPTGPFPWLSPTADVTEATTTGDPANSCVANLSRSVWYSFTPPAAGTFSFSLCDTTGTTVQDTVLGLYSGTACSSFNQTACNDDSCGSRSAFTATLAGATSYYVVAWKLGALAPAPGSSLIQLAVNIAAPPPPPPANDTCAAAQVVPPAGPFPWLSTVVDVTGATAAGDPTPSCQANVSHSVWYRFTPSAAGTYALSLCTPDTGTTVNDTVLALYTGTSCAGIAELTCNDDGCGSRSGLTATLVAGTTYYAVAYKLGPADPAVGASSMQLSVATAAPAPANDVCSAATPLTLDVPLSSSNLSATNDYQLAGAACFLGVGQNVTTASGIDTAYRFTAPAAGPYSFRLRDATQDTVLHVSSTCPTGTPPLTVSTCQSAANRNASSAEEVACLSMTNGEQVYAFADRTGGGLGSTFSLEVNVCRQETEPNETPATASAFACGLTGRTTPAGDIDFFRVGAPAAGARLFALVDGVTANNSDFDLRVTSATVALEYDDGDNDAPLGSLAPNIEGTPLVGGPAYLRVTQYWATTEAEPYRLYAVVQGALALATPEVEPNATTAQATSAASNYFSGSLDGTSPSSDVDVYSFTATAGDLLILGLDGDPLRDNTPLDARLELLDAAGTTLLGVNDPTAVSATASSGVLTGTSPSSPGEALTWRATATGTYFVRVRAGSTSATTAAGDYLLSISRNCLVGSGAPVVAAIAPATGTASGGTAVTLTGTNFVAGSAVTIGGVPATSVSVSGPFELTAVTGAHAAGAADVVVTSPTAQAGTLTGGFTYGYTGPAPTVTAVTPATGSLGGGTAITLTGTGFAAGASVTIGGVAATGVTVVSATSITATTPVGTAGAKAVVVRNADTQSGTLANGFTYVAAAPTLTAVNPATGPLAGGTAITLTGTGFVAGASVTIGGVAATGLTVVSATSITATTPAGSAGAQAVVVTNPDAQSATLAGGFTWVTGPTLTALTPATGPLTGGTSVTLAGTGFVAGATVTIGGTAATGVTVVSATSITATTPAGPAGAAAVLVRNPDAQSATLASGFTWVGPPTVTSIAPATGPLAGGTSVTLTGTGFSSGATVTIGGVAATGVTVVSATSLIATTPAGTAGAKAVVVRNADSQSGTLNGFTYLSAPTVTAISPASGPVAGGTSVTITGTGFLAGASVTIGGTAATAVTVVSATSLTALTPAGNAGAGAVVVTNPDSQSSTLAAGFTWVSAPTVTAINPASGPVVGGTSVRLTGTGFVTGASVTIGGAAATGIAVVSGTSLTALTPAGSAGAGAVVVTNPDGQSSTLPGGFTWVSPPTVTGIDPASGSVTGGTYVTLTGTGFLSGATVLIGGEAASKVVVVSATSLTATTRARSAGQVEVLVTNTDAQSGTLSAGFTYLDAATGGGAGGGNVGGGAATGGGASTGGGSGASTGGGGGSDAGGCGCASVDVSAVGFALLGLLLGRRRSAR